MPARDDEHKEHNGQVPHLFEAQDEFQNQRSHQDPGHDESGYRARFQQLKQGHHDERSGKQDDDVDQIMGIHERNTIW